MQQSRWRTALKPKLYRGAKITAVTSNFVGEIVGTSRARVLRAHRGRISGHAVGSGKTARGDIYLRDEGRTWVCGWDTPEAMVLAAEIALLVSR